MLLLYSKAIALIHTKFLNKKRHVYLELQLQLGIDILHLFQRLLRLSVPCTLNADLMSVVLLQVLNVPVQVLCQHTTAESTLTNKQHSVLSSHAAGCNCNEHYTAQHQSHR